MFDNLQKALQDIDRTGSMTFQIDLDEKGYIDRECPDARCLFQFKVKPDSGTNSGSATRSCPMCGHSAPADQFHTTEQVKQAKKLALSKLQGLFDNAMRRDADKFNSNQPRQSFLKISMKVSGTRPYSHVDVPISSTEAMQLEIKCTSCAAEYAVIGSAFFCPLCGDCSAPRVFDDALRKISAKKNFSAEARTVIAMAAGKDQGELVARSLVESCISDGVVAFQRFCEVTYRGLPHEKEPLPNVFQRLTDGSQLWRELVGEGYEDWIDTTDFAALHVLFQRRHLLAHSDGIVDEKYVAKSGDSTYKVGQRILVSEFDVDTLVRVLSTLVRNIRRLTSVH